MPFTALQATKSTLQNKVRSSDMRAKWRDYHIPHYTVRICQHIGPLAFELQTNHPTFMLSCVVKTGGRNRNLTLSSHFNSHILNNRLCNAFFPPLKTGKPLFLFLLSGNRTTKKTFTDLQTDPCPNKELWAQLHSPLLYFSAKLQQETNQGRNEHHKQKI